MERRYSDKETGRFQPVESVPLSDKQPEQPTEEKPPAKESKEDFQEYLANLRNEQNEYERKLRELQNKIQLLMRQNTDKESEVAVAKQGGSTLQKKDLNASDSLNSRKFQTTQNINDLRDDSISLKSMPQARLKTRKIEEYDLIEDLPPAQNKHHTIDQRSGQAGSRQRATNLESLDMSNSNLKDGIQFRKIDDSINDGLSPHLYD